MPLDLTETTALHKNQLESEYPFIWLFELQTKDDPPQRYRLTNFNQQVQFDEDADGNSLLYYPAPIAHGGIEKTSEGDLPSISVSLATGGAFWLTSAVDNADGFIGQPAVVMVVSALELDNPDAAIREDVIVTAVAMDANSVTFSMSAFNVFSARFPPFQYSRRRCRWIFGSAECGYNINATGAGFSECGYTFEDCTERGDDEEANAAVGVRGHPARFGGFPGTPRVPRR